MSFLGVITHQKNEQYIRKKLLEYFIEDHIININEKNIRNIKNVSFETILIDRKIDNTEELKNIISKSKYVVLNSDLQIDIKMLEDLNLNIITYGFNNKATFTISSITENNMIICLQRIIGNIFHEKYEPQEFEVKIERNRDITAIMGVLCVMLVYGGKYKTFV